MQKTKSPASARLLDLQSSKIELQKELLVNLADKTPVMLWLSGIDQQYNFFNQAWLDYTGHTLDEEIRLGSKAVVHPDDQRGYHDTYTQSFKERKLFQIEFRLKRNDGHYRRMFCICKPNIVDDEFIGYVGSCIDIQDQLDATQLLKDTIDKIQQLLDALPNLAWRNDLTGKAVYSNRYWLELTGQTTEDLMMNGPKAYVHPDDYIKVDKLWLIHAKNGLPLETEIRYLRAADKTYRWYLVRAVPVKNNFGRLIAWISTATDIHDHKEFEIELEQRMAGRTKELTEINQQLKNANHDLQQFAYVASHDLQEPLRKIILYTSRLEQEFKNEMPPKAVEHMQRISVSAKRMTKMISDLLNFTLVAHDEKQFVETDLNEILKKAIKDFESTISLRNVSITAPPLPVIEAAKGEMLQLFHHLLSNALKFSADVIDPVIKISLRQLSVKEVGLHYYLNSNLTYVEICFQDNGMGFEQQLAEQIFTVFQRLHGKTEFPGTGIGLALCAKIVQKHNGIIFAKSEKNKGAAFYVVLPLHQKPKQS